MSNNVSFYHPFIKTKQLYVILEFQQHGLLVLSYHTASANSSPF